MAGTKDASQLSPSWIADVPVLVPPFQVGHWPLLGIVCMSLHWFGTTYENAGSAAGLKVVGLSGTTLLHSDVNVIEVNCTAGLWPFLYSGSLVPVTTP